MHAREWITALTVIELIKIYEKKEFDGCVAFVPLVNPDGTRLAMDGVTKFFTKRKSFLTQVNNGSYNFSLWKANANAVDINVNFDANWGGGEHNVFVPAPANFVGDYPESEPETAALVKFVNEFRPTGNIAFHSKGEVIYYGFKELPQKQIEYEREIAEALAVETGYAAEQSINSAGGLCDWTAQTTGAPSLTIEVGSDSLPHPITEKYLPEIVGQVKNVIDFL
jgi:g-D-glutamyl-meso-diaminopimelate peptidase